MVERAGMLERLGHRIKALVPWYETPDPVPMAPPIGYNPQPSLFEQVRAMVQSEHLRREAEAAGYESFEEADDFEIDDDPVDPTIPYEEKFDVEERYARQKASVAPSVVPANPPAAEEK